MTCATCSTKMSCRYSVPLAPNARYRRYTCPKCKAKTETIELPKERLRTVDTTLIGEIEDRIARQRLVVQRVLLGLKRKRLSQTPAAT